ncbi:MAG: hypothetical protein KY476_14835 [Planctomycetes bacterium]|nr:hypothetical protein [Planctomycetota bacterium]
MAVWSRTVGEGKEEREMLSATISKQYKSGDEWKETGFFNHSEVAVVASLLQEAFAYITEEMARE